MNQGLDFFRFHKKLRILGADIWYFVCYTIRSYMLKIQIRRRFL